MPDTLTYLRRPDGLPPLPPASSEWRRRWADLLWATITGVEKGVSSYWVAEQLKYIAAEIEPPLKPNGDVDG